MSRKNLKNTAGAARELGVSRQRILQYLKDNRIKGATKVGRDWVIPSPVEVVAPPKRD